MSAGAITYSIGLKNRGFLSGIDGARTGLRSLGSSIQGIVAKAGMLTAALGAGGILGSLALLKRASASAADIETLSTSFRVLIGDATEADAVLSRLRTLGNSTPFEFPEIAHAGKLLIAFGEDSDQVADTLARIGDVASGLSVPLGELADIYGKARVQGTLYAEDLNQLAGRGVPIFQELARILNVSTAEVKELASEGRITFPMLQQVFRDLTSEGGQFYGMMVAQSGTLNGLLSTLRDAWNDLLITIGQPVNDFLKPMLQGAIARLKTLGESMRAFFQLLGSAREQGRLAELLGTSLQVAFTKGVNTLSGGVRGIVAYLGTALPQVFQAATDTALGDRLLTSFKLTFDGISRTLAAAMREAIADLADVFHRGNFADGMRDFAASDRDFAANSFTAAAAGLRTATWEELQQVTDAISAAHQAGAAAFDAASSTNLLDEGPALKRLAALGTDLDPDAWQKFQDALTGTMPEAVDQAARKIKTGANDLKTETDKITNSLGTVFRKAPAAAGAARPAGVEPTPPPRIRLHGAEESARRRFERLSKADREKHRGSFDRFIDSFRGDALGLGREILGHTNPPSGEGSALLDRLGGLLANSPLGQGLGGSLLGSLANLSPRALADRLLPERPAPSPIHAPRDPAAHHIAAARSQARSADQILRAIASHTASMDTRLADLGLAT